MRSFLVLKHGVEDWDRGEKTTVFFIMKRSRFVKHFTEVQKLWRSFPFS